MALLPNPDGTTYTLTDPDGNLISQTVPAHLVDPSQVFDVGSSVSGAMAAGLEGAGEAAAVPPPEPAPAAPDAGLYMNPGVAPPVSDLAMATAGPGAPDAPILPEGSTIVDLPPQKRAFENTVPSVPKRPAVGDAQAIQGALGFGSPSTGTGAVDPSKLTGSPAAAAGANVAAGGAEAVGLGTGDPMPSIVSNVSSEVLTGKKVYSAPRKEAWIPQSMSVEHQAATSPETKLGVAMAYQNAIDTARANAAGQSAVLTEQALGYEKQRDQAQSELDLLKKKEAERDAALRPRMQTLDKHAEHIRSFRIDPDAYWEKKGPVGTVLANIGIALGALGSAVTGGPNQVYQKVRAEVEDEINAQQTTLASMKAGLEAETNTLAQMRQLFISPEAAEVATRALLSETVAAESRRMAAEMGSQEALANGEALAAKFSLDAAKDREKAEQLEGGAIREALKYQAPSAGGWTHVGPRNYLERVQALAGVAKLFNRPLEDIIRISTGHQNVYGLSPEQQKLAQQDTKMVAQLAQTAWRDPQTGKTLYAPNEESGNKFRLGAPALWKMKQNLAEIAEIYKRNPIGVLSHMGKDYGRVLTLVSDNDSFAKNAIVGDAMQAHEEMRVAAETGRTALDRTNFANRAESFKAAQEALSARIDMARAQSREVPISGAYGAPVNPSATNYKVPTGAIKVEPKKKAE